MKFRELRASGKTQQTNKHKPNLLGFFPLKKYENKQKSPKRPTVTRIRWKLQACGESLLFFPKLSLPGRLYFLPMAIAFKGQGDPTAEVGGADLREDRKDRWITSTCPQPWPLRARLLNRSVIHGTEKCASCLKTCLYVNAPPTPFVSHPLPPPSNWLSIAFLRTLKLMFSLAKTWPLPLKNQTSEKERRDLTFWKASFHSRLAFPFVAQGEAWAGVRGKGSSGLTVLCLGHWRFDPSLPLPLKDLKGFRLTPHSCKHHPPSLQCLMGLNFTRLHYSRGGEACPLLWACFQTLC